MIVGMIQRIAIIVAAVGCMTVLAAFTSARITLFEVQREANDLIITWQAEEEDGVREYELNRLTPYSNNTWTRIKSMPAHGAGKLYRHRDDQVYKNASEMVDYRLDVVYQDGTRTVGVRTASINYTSTAVRRTWGSIKAMFQ